MFKSFALFAIGLAKPDEYKLVAPKEGGYEEEAVELGKDAKYSDKAGVLFEKMDSDEIELTEFKVAIKKGQHVEFTQKEGEKKTFHLFLHADKEHDADHAKKAAEHLILAQETLKAEEAAAEEAAAQAAKEAALAKEKEEVKSLIGRLPEEQRGDLQQQLDKCIDSAQVSELRTSVQTKVDAAKKEEAEKKQKIADAKVAAEQAIKELKECNKKEAEVAEFEKQLNDKPEEKDAEYYNKIAKEAGELKKEVAEEQQKIDEAKAAAEAAIDAITKLKDYEKLSVEEKEKVDEIVNELKKQLEKGKVAADYITIKEEADKCKELVEVPVFKPEPNKEELEKRLKDLIKDQQAELEKTADGKVQLTAVNEMLEKIAKDENYESKEKIDAIVKKEKETYRKVASFVSPDYKLAKDAVEAAEKEKTKMTEDDKKQLEELVKKLDSAKYNDDKVELNKIKTETDKLIVPGSDWCCPIIIVGLVVVLVVGGIALYIMFQPEEENDDDEEESEEEGNEE